MTAPRSGSRVYLHIGAPKTGTTYLQDRLSRNARSLARHGVHVPRSSRRLRPDQSHFKAALDLLGQDWGGPPGHAKDGWANLLRTIKAVNRRHRVVVSHEILAPASAEVVQRVLDDLGDREVHIVYSARDLGRQLPAAWQEGIKQGRRWSFKKSCREVLAGRTMFGQSFDLPQVLETWGANLPPERLHVVTVPHTGGDALWLRYCEAFGINPRWAPKETDRANESLGVPEIQLLRMLNQRFDNETRRSQPYDRLIRGMLGHQVLSGRGSAPVRVSPKRYAAVEERTDEIIEWLRRRQVDIIGDIDDLRPRWPAAGTPRTNLSDTATPEVLDAAMVALEAMTHEAARRPASRLSLSQRARSGMARLRGDL